MESFALGVKPPGTRDQDEEQEDSAEQEKSSVSTGTVVGIVIGVLAAVIVSCILYKKCHKSNPGHQSSVHRVTQAQPSAPIPSPLQAHHIPYGQTYDNNRPYVIPSENPPSYSAAVGYYNNAHASAPPYNPVKTYPPNWGAS